MKTLILHPKNNSQVEALKAFAIALKVPYEIEAETPYDPEFVAQILDSSANAKPGTGLKIDLDNLWK